MLGWLVVACFAGSDFELPVTTVTLTSTITVSVEIVNYEIPEPKHEEIKVTFCVSEETVTFLPSSFVTITIEDNDSKAQ